jgi:hypothetical protein
MERQHLRVLWNRFADRVSEILTRGLPAACASQQPKNELHLQEICDGLLRAADENLNREFPFVRWASRLAKPDWSGPSLWVELKFVRSSGDVRRATEDIASDITKYGDNGRQTLFAVYDPNHEIKDENEFAADIERHDGNAVKIIR